MAPPRLDLRATWTASCIALGACAVHGHDAVAPNGTLLPQAGGLARNGRPRIAVVEREGDPSGAFGVAVNTAGIADGRGALVGVALGALVEERLALRGIQASAAGGWGGWRLRTLVTSAAEAATLVDAVRAAMLTPVVASEPALAAVARRAAALALRRLPDASLRDIAQCTGDAFGLGDEHPPGPEELESWRVAAHGLGRTALACAGRPEIANGVTTALERGAPWPAAAPPTPAPWPSPDARATVYDASGELPPGAARVIVTARTAAPERAVAAARALGAVAGPLASRLGALETPARLVSVTATAHPDGGCLTATIDLSPHDLASDVAARIATAAALAREEIGVEVSDTIGPPDLGHTIAATAPEPRDAAERAAWWMLAGPRSDVGSEGLRLNLAVGVAAARGATEAALPSPESIRAEIDRATLAWHTGVVEARTRVERGQGEAWLLLASPCGTFAEAMGDAGAGAAVALAASARARSRADDAQVEPFVATDGVGLLIHGPRHPGETPQAHARRLADVAARALAADAPTNEDLVQARTRLLLDASRTEARAREALAAVLAPGHPSWLDPPGTALGLASASDATIAMHAASIRAGPLRVAVLSDVDQPQADAAIRAVDRWVARRAGEARICPPVPALAAPRPGTYPVDRPAGAQSEALIAMPLRATEEGAPPAAVWLAAALNGGDGLLAHALGAVGASTPGAQLARSWSASVVSAGASAALILSLIASDDSLDAAVAQSRALLDRLRRGALREEDLTRAGSVLAHERLARALDPRARTIALWRGERPAPRPSLSDLRAFVADHLVDEALIIVAARPSRVTVARSLGPRPKQDSP